MVLNFCKDHFVLISTDGDFKNVIKIKPPIVFSKKDCDLLLKTLAKAFDYVQNEMMNPEYPKEDDPHHKH